MNKEELIWKTSVYLKQNNCKKELPPQKGTFRVTDSLGNIGDFVVRTPSKPVDYTMSDISSIFDAVIRTIEDSLAKGEDVTIRGFGTFSVTQRKESATVHPITRERIVIKPHYVPKFSAGNGLKMAAKMYDLSFGETDGEAGE